MTEVAPSCPEMTALAPPPAPLISSRNASPARSPSSHNSTTEISEVLRDKTRRAQQQLDRSAEERGRKMDVQKRKEQQRRVAAGEKRRQQQEAEKVREYQNPLTAAAASHPVYAADVALAAR
ncbi:ensconsin-like [Cottoperca gobio]|uniref:Ensconsin-like n=1 Tax=Cottoperca gobio TaxID=56716 RepID=A0A6J2P8B9_COTGO|nr:ensconsin-like [Cottoperca gobio]